MRKSIAVFVFLLVVQVAHPLPVLRDLAANRHFNVGSCVNPQALTSDRNYSSVLGSQYNIVVPENAMKWDATEPRQGAFDYSQGDAVVNFANSHGQLIRGHNLCWGQSNPSWLTNGNFNPAQLQQILQNHITNVATHYRGKLYGWDVVNEAVNDNPNAAQPLKNTIWYPKLPNYIDLAFQYAHAADPGAKLFYNDYSAEGSGAKSDAVYNLVRGMKQRGIPVHGVGLQMHVSLGYSPSPNDISANIQRLTALGLEVHITEMDVSFSGGSGSEQQKLTNQATIYGNILRACLSHANCTSFLTWGFTDKYTWLGSSNEPLPFSASYVAKPAFEQLASVLQGK